MTPDWAAAPEAVPYANFFNPQTLNLYAIVANNPESFADLDGHLPELAAPGGGLTPDGQLDDCGDDQQKCGAQDQSQLSHLVPTPKGTNCSQKGVICENDGKSKRVGDYDGDKFCNASGCFVWHGDGNGHGQWLALPFDQLKKDLEALSELEMLSSRIFSKYSQRAFVSGGMIGSGATVAGATATGQFPCVLPHFRPPSQLFLVGGQWRAKESIICLRAASTFRNSRYVFYVEDASMNTHRESWLAWILCSLGSLAVFAAFWFYFVFHRLLGLAVHRLVRPFIVLAILVLCFATAAKLSREKLINCGSIVPMTISVWSLFLSACLWFVYYAREFGYLNPSAALVCYIGSPVFIGLLALTTYPFMRWFARAGGPA